jgi:hypothetical protein
MSNSTPFPPCIFMILQGHCLGFLDCPLECQPECSIANFILTSLQDMVPSACVSICDSVALYFSLPLV